MVSICGRVAVSGSLALLQASPVPATSRAPERGGAEGDRSAEEETEGTEGETMKWSSNWWGITIQAESDQDEKLLHALRKALPDKAAHSYEDGEVSLIDGPPLVQIVE